MDVTNTHSDFANFESFSNFNQYPKEEDIVEIEDDNKTLDNNWATEFEQADFQTFKSGDVQAFELDGFQTFENLNPKTDKPADVFEAADFQGFDDVLDTQYDISKRILKDNFGQTGILNVKSAENADVISLVTM